MTVFDRPPPPSWYQTRQPFKAAYIGLHALTLLPRMPYWLLTAAMGYRPRKSWSIKRTFMVKLLRTARKVVTEMGFTLTRDLTQVPPPSSLKISQFLWVPPVPRDKLGGIIAETAAVNAVSTQSVPCFWFKRPDDLHKSFHRAGPADSVVLFTHGGSYMIGSAHESNIAGGTIPPGLLANSNIGSVLSVDYRLARQAPFPAALMDGLAGYASDLVNECGYDPSRIILAGDSAGGNLILALARYLRDEKPYPIPAAMILLSPWCDLTLTPTRSSAENVESDYIGPYFGHEPMDLFFEHLSEDVRRSPYCSPSGPSIKEQEWPTVFADFPPTLIAAGGAERLYDEINELRKRLVAAGNQVRWLVEPEALHDWCQFTWHEPERTRTLREVATWIDKVL